MTQRKWAVRHPGIGVLHYDSEQEAVIAAGTAAEMLGEVAGPRGVSEKVDPLLVQMVGYRVAMDVSQGDLASAMRVDRKTVNRWENGFTIITLPMAQEYARQLGGRLVFVADEPEDR
jgi:DNA-binding XRE family transcriptional regulator